MFGAIDNEFEQQRLQADAAGNRVLAAQIEAKQRINDQAYFVLCWGQFEAGVDEACRKAIRKGQAARTWRDRRAWDLYNPDDKRLSGLSFEDRLALVIERKAPAWKLITGYYALRNQIAHGGFAQTPIDVPSVVKDLYTVQSQLTV